jgi:DNA polymerase-1
MWLALQVWHNYSFDKQILQREGLAMCPRKLEMLGMDPKKLTLVLGGFAGDTMHLARLHDATRKGTKTYSLSSLSGDREVMSGKGGVAAERGKISMKALFARPMITKSGKPSASVKQLPPIHEIQACSCWRG